MPLPSLIEIVPPATPVEARVTIPGSKSITNRALVLAAMAKGRTVLKGCLWSDDTQIMVECLQRMGWRIHVGADSLEPCNRTITVEGQGGHVPCGGTEAEPLELFVGNAGTAARFLTPLVCLGSGVYRLSGVARMHERPQAALFQALRQLGYRIDAGGDRLPALIFGHGVLKGRCSVSIAESSQFASALLLANLHGGWDIDIVGDNADESPYVQMTSKLIGSFPATGGEFQVEPDTSSGSYFLAAGMLPGWSVDVLHWPSSNWQIDQRFADYSRDQNGLVCSPAWRRISRRDDLGDSIMTAISLAPLLPDATVFTDLGRLRLQECERVQALRTELTKCGARVEEKGDTLIVFPSDLHGAEIETYDDHRMAMCFAVLGLAVAGIRLKHPACVKKTFPDFFLKLAGPRPAGLGITIRDGMTGRGLSPSELFAE